MNGGRNEMRKWGEMGRNGDGVLWEVSSGVGLFFAGGTLGEGMGTPWLRPFQKVKNP